MLLGSLVIFLSVFVNSLKSFNLRRISDLQSQNNYFYSVQHPVAVMENSLITEVPSPHFSSTKGPVSSVEIQNHSKQLDQLMNSRSNVTEDLARIKSRIKPLNIKRKFKNKRRIHKKVSKTRSRLHYTELKRLKSIHPDESNKLLNKGVINDSGKKHGSRAIKNILKTNFAETEDAVSSAKNVASKRKGYNEIFPKQKTKFNKKGISRTLESKKEFSISAKSKIDALTKSFSKPSITRKTIENNNKGYIEELLAKKKCYKNRSERGENNIIETHHLPKRNNSHHSRLFIGDHKVYSPRSMLLLKKQRDNIHKNRKGKYRDDSKQYVDKKHNNIEKSADETSHVKNYLKRYFRCQKDDDKCVQKSKVKNKIIHSLHTAEYVTSSNVIRANKQHPLQIKEGQEIKKSQKTAAMLHQPTKLKHKNRSANLSVNNRIRTFAHTDQNMLIPNKNIRQKHVFRKNIVNIKKPETDSSRRKYEVNQANNNQGTIAIIQENTKANTSILEIYSKDFVTKNITNLKGGQFHSSNVSVTSTTQSANTLKSNYNKPKEKATINFVTTPFLNYSELNKTGINYFRQYSKDVVFSGMSVKINGSSIKKNDKQPQSPKDVLYDLISRSGVDLTKISVEGRGREREYYLPPDELTFDEMALVDPSLSPIALSARAIEWTLLGWCYLGILFMSIIFLLFAKVKDKHSYHYIKKKITDNEALKNFVSAFSFAAREKVETPELILKTPSSSCSSYVSLSSVVGDNFKENPSHNWDSVEKFLLKR